MHIVDLFPHHSQQLHLVDLHPFLDKPINFIYDIVDFTVVPVQILQQLLQPLIRSLCAIGFLFRFAQCVPLIRNEEVVHFGGDPLPPDGGGEGLHD